MKLHFLGATALVLMAGPALSQSQLERSVNVQPGIYNNAQLVDLKRANDDGDRTRIAYLSRMSDWSRPATAEDRLDAAERLLVNAALEQNEFNRARFIEAGGLRMRGGGEDEAKSRLARELNVDADSYTLARLTTLRSERDD